MLTKHGLSMREQKVPFWTLSVLCSLANSKFAACFLNGPNTDPCIDAISVQGSSYCSSTVCTMSPGAVNDNDNESEWSCGV